MMYRAGGGQHGGAAGREGEANQSRPSHFERGLGVRRDLHDSALPGERSGEMKIAVDNEGQDLGPSPTTVKDRENAVRVDLVHGIDTGGRTSGDHQDDERADGQVVG